MASSLLLRRTATVATLALLAACGDSGSPTEILDPTEEISTTELQAKATAVGQITSDPALAEFTSFGQSFGVREGSLRALTAGPSAAIRLAESKVTDGTLDPREFEFAAVIPDTLHGRTYRWSANQGSWVEDPNTAGPSDGVRVYIHPYNPTTGVPGATAVGYVEYRDSSTANGNVVNAQIFNNSDAKLANLRLTQVEAQNSTGIESTTSINGTLGASQQIQVADTIRTTETQSDFSSSFRVRTTIPGQSLSLFLGMEEPSQFQRSTQELSITLGDKTASIRGSSAALEGSASNGPDSLSVYLNDALVARSVVQPGQDPQDAGFVGPNGQAVNQQTLAWTAALFSLVDKVPMGWVVAMILEFLLLGATFGAML